MSDFTPTQARTVRAWLEDVVASVTVRETPLSLRQGFHGMPPLTAEQAEAHDASLRLWYLRALQGYQHRPTTADHQ
jgi:hypothetical protein